MYDIITFGSATRDVYVHCKDMMVVQEKRFISGKGIAVSLGSKIELEDIRFRTGGGGTNAAVTFCLQGYKTAWCGMVGDDLGGKEVLQKLRACKIDRGLISIGKKKHTNYSIVLCPEKQDRTILVYHGVSSELSSKDIPWKKILARWLYLAPLSGDLSRLFGPLVDFAKEHNIRVAANPGNSQLRMKKSVLKRIFSKIDVLLLNQEEAFLATGTRAPNDKKILKKLTRMTGGIVAVTKGPEGAVCSDGKHMWRAPVLKTRVVDRTGAGDAFGAGFVSEHMRSGNIEKSLQFGIANSAACISQWGAKEGLLKRGQKWRRVPVTKVRLN